MFYFRRKSHESKEGHFPSYFYRKHNEHKGKMSFSSENAYVFKTRNKLFMKLTNKDPR